MLNYIWLGLMVAAVIVGGCTGQLKDVADKGLEWANLAVVNIAFALIGIMALWLGIMRLAERAGLVALLARVLRPVLRLVFPDIPAGHPAMGSMLMNISANMLGLGNAATPLGLRAMKDLESLNRHPGIATNAMCTFLAINTSGVQLIPITAIAILAANKSTNPTAIVSTSIICTACAAVCGVLMAKILSQLPMFRLPAPLDGLPPGKEPQGFDSTAVTATDEKPPFNEGDAVAPLHWWGYVILAGFLFLFGFFFLRLIVPETLGLPVAAETVKLKLYIRVINAFSLLAIPFLLSAIPLFASLRRVKVYEEFVEGAKEGFNVAIRIIPYLVAMLVAVGMFRAAGGIDLFSRALAPVLGFFGFPTDLLPMVLVRPLSGTGSLGFFTELVKQFGPDSLIARTAGTIYGSTETTFYVLAVYFGSVGVTRTRHALLAGLTADFVSVMTAVMVCRIVFK
jgi:spore maturation protein SpmA